MQQLALNLKDIYPFLGEDGRDPILHAVLLRNFSAKSQTNPNRPAILILPGGGYGLLSVRERETVGLPFLASGFNIFVLEYSVAPHRDPSQIVEVAAAMDLIRKNAEQWHVDPNRIAGMGFSAGGHLSAYYSNRFDCEAVRKHFPDSRRPNACVLGYARLTADEAYLHTPCIERLVGHAHLTDEERTAFSCEKMVTDRTPPTFIWTTRMDEIVSVMDSLLYAEALAKHDVPFSMHIYPVGKHGLVTGDEMTNRPEVLANGASLAHSWIGEAIAWLNLTFQIGI
ncbi:MAG: alpha/beta hydrolase [Oscillospiraceae bacterium]|nr:alpha/beta hydrolase [Oscillospiraceae bacterium]